MSKVKRRASSLTLRVGMETAVRNRPNEAPMPDPLAYFLTWPTYGTWLPGDERGWIEFHHGWQMPDPSRELEACAKMTEGAARLSANECVVVEGQIAETCAFRCWLLHAVNCRTNHVHVVVSARSNPRIVRSQLKAWCTRALNNYRRTAILLGGAKSSIVERKNGWAERGSQRFINDEDGLEAAILYVCDGQDKPRPVLPRKNVRPH